MDQRQYEVHIVQQFHKLNKQINKQTNKFLNYIEVNGLIKTKISHQIVKWNKMKIEIIHKPTIPNVQTSDFLLYVWLASDSGAIQRIGPIFVLVYTNNLMNFKSHNENGRMWQLFTFPSSAFSRIRAIPKS
jgi:hypothetical protein